MTPDRLARELSKDSIAPFYCLYGEEIFLINEAVEGIVDRVLGDAPRDFNLDIFYAGSVQPAQILDVAETLPMMAAKRVIVVKEIQNFREKQLEILSQLFKMHTDTTVIIFVGSKADQRRKFYKTFNQHGHLVKFSRPKEDQVPGWLHSMAKKHGKNLDSQACFLMLQLVGPNLIELHNELLKVVQYVGDKTDITWKDVDTIVSRVRVESVFDLANAVGKGDRAEALTCLVNLLDHGENEVGVLALVSRHIRLLLITKEALSEGVSNGQIATKVGVPPYFLSQYIDQSKRWTRKQLEKAHHLLLETDRALKSSPVSSHIWLENFVVKSCDILETA